MKVRSIACVLAGILVLGGCRTDTPATSSVDGGESAEVVREQPSGSVPQAPRDVKGIMLQNPGLYAGDRYDEKKVQQELDKLPRSLSTDQWYDHLVHLLGENYQPIHSKLKAMDPTIQPTRKTPDGKIEMPTIEKIRVQIVLDASGSMAGKVSGGQKMNLAKSAIREFVANLPEGSEVSLRVYGHKGTGQKKDKELSCGSNELLYPMGAYDSGKFMAALEKVKPAGWTPLASAISAARADLEHSSQEGIRNVVYVVSDGIETCGGKPVEEAKKLANVGIKPVVNIVGFDVDNAGQRQLQSVAEAAGGVFKSVHTARDLEEYLKAEKERLYWEWRDWGVQSELDAWRMWAQKYQEMTKLCYGKSGEGMASLAGIEYDRMSMAVKYLKETGKLDDTQQLEEALLERLSKVEENALAWDRHLSRELKKAQLEAEEQIRQKTREQQSNLQ
ncbi:vWA domain-containing protein [Staphylospora marina]|uniref:vWA domain-containing protein n=1 Tax=Staphylospora marina TaxID=2490858 RepID=UPI000F5BEBA4|nr:VWA domain-containing protein [Staphylospora marina]